jgi:glycosyltransferase involved in cell wall biosynthesis
MMMSDLLIFRYAVVALLLLSAALILKTSVPTLMHGQKNKMHGQKNKSVIAGEDMLIWMSPFDDSGFGSEAANLLQTLITGHKLNQDNLWIDATQDWESGCNHISASSQQLTILEPAMQRWKIHQRLYDNPIIGVVICHSLPPFWRSSSSNEEDVASQWSTCAPCPPTNSQVGIRIGRAMAETDRYHPKFVQAAENMDEIWVPSQFSLDVLASSGVTRAKIKIVPIPVDTDRFNPISVEPASLLSMGEALFEAENEGAKSAKLRGTASATAGLGLQDKRPFVFLSTFKWEDRKGWDVLLDAFMSTFKSTDRAALHILTKPNGGGGLDGIRRAVKDHFNHRGTSANTHTSMKTMPMIRIITSHLSPDEYVRVYKSSDVYVTSSRGEGWGMPITEAMSMGLPVISTNWSGSADIINTSYAWPIGYALEAVEVQKNDPIWWFEGSKWARANMTELAQVMRYAFEHKDECREKGKIARKVAEEKYSITAVASIIGQEVGRVRKLGQGKKFEEVREIQTRKHSDFKRYLDGWREDGYFGSDYNDHFVADRDRYFDDANKEWTLDSDDRFKNGFQGLSSKLSDLDDLLQASKGSAKDEGYELYSFPPGVHDKEGEDLWGSDM